MDISAPIVTGRFIPTPRGRGCACGLLSAVQPASPDTWPWAAGQGADPAAWLSAHSREPCKSAAHCKVPFRWMPNRRRALSPVRTSHDAAPTVNRAARDQGVSVTLEETRRSLASSPQPSASTWERTFPWVWRGVPGVGNFSLSTGRALPAHCPGPDVQHL